MRELREETFLGNKNDDAHEHVEMILDFISLFNILGVTHDAIMLRVFPITLTEAAKRWVDRLPPGTINTWDLLKKAFIQRYCPPSKMAKQLEEIHNFKQEGDETLYQAWERKISNGSSDGIAAIINKLDSLGRDMKKLKENVHAIQVGCETCEGAHLNKECPLHEEVSKKMDEGPSEVLPCQLPPKELSPGSFTLPCTIGSLNFYVMEDLGASVNIMRKSMFNHLKLTNLKKTNMLVEMADITKKAPMGIVENIFVKIDKFLFPLDFMIIGMLGDPNETMILGRSFLATIHAGICF
ncbi:phospholipase-like protein [Tanacetum coccineum]